MNTKFTICIILFVFFMLHMASVFAQTTLEVTAPESISGKIQCAYADFGPFTSLGTTSGDIVYVSGVDSFGCSAISLDLSNKIALIDRGNCDYSEKAFNAQEAGAAAVIIALEPGRELMFVVPGGNMADQVTIPVIAMLERDYLDIKQVLLSTTVSARIYTQDEFIDENIVYEETFDGGLGQWTTSNPTGPDSPWVWTADGDANGSVFFC